MTTRAQEVIQLFIQGNSVAGIAWHMRICEPDLREKFHGEVLEEVEEILRKALRRQDRKKSKVKVCG